MKLWKRLGALLVVVSLMMTLLPSAFAAQATGAITLTIGSPTMSVNGASKTIDAEGSRATLYQGNTMLPLRGVVENMGGTLEWNAQARNITIKYNGSTVVLTLGSKIAYVNGAQKTMPVAPFTDSGRTYVWLRTLEYFPGVTVTWRADTRQATVVYPMVAGSAIGTRPVQLTFVNTTSLMFNKLEFAPAGTEDWGENILTNPPLYTNATQTVTANLGKAIYDLRGTDWYGNKFYYRNLDFSKFDGGVGHITLYADSATLLLDGVPVSGTDAFVNLNLYNYTGQQIKSIVYAPASTNIWSGELLNNYYFNNNTATTLRLGYASARPYYDFRVTYATGIQQVFTGVNLSSSFGTVVVSLNPNGQYSYTAGGGTGSGVGSTSITFYNKSGKTIHELRMAATNSNTAFNQAENLIDKTSSGSSDSFNFNMAGTRKWYLRAYDSRGDVVESGSITFSSTATKSATITLKRDGFYLGSGNSSVYDIEAGFVNTSGKDLYAIFALDPDDDYKSSWDYDDFNSEYDDLGELDNQDWDTFSFDTDGDGYVRLVCFTNDRDFFEKKVKFDTRANYGLVEISSTGSSGISVRDDDQLSTDETFIVVHNADSSRIKRIEYRDYDGDLSWKELTTSISGKSSTIVKFTDLDEDDEWDFRIEYENGKTATIEDCDLSSADLATILTCYESESDCDWDTLV